MQRIQFLSVSIICCLLTSHGISQEVASLPNATDVISRFVEVTGGEQAYRNLKSIRMVGKMTMPKQNIRGTMEIIATADGKSYTRAVIVGVGSESGGGDGTTYWSESPFTGTRVIEGAEKDRMIQESDLQARLHPNKYYKSIDVTGTEVVRGEACYRLELLRRVGATEYEYFSVESGLLVKSDVVASTPLGEISVSVYLSDYRTVSNVKMSFKSERLLPGNNIQLVEFDSIKANEPITAKTFDLPKAVKQLVERSR